MFGKSSRVSPLAVRKQLLIAESELNRTQLDADTSTLTAGVRMLADRAKSIGSVASVATLLVAGFAVARRGNYKGAEGKRSWWQWILKGAGTVSSLWLAFHRQRHEQAASSETSPRL